MGADCKVRPRIVRHGRGPSLGQARLAYHESAAFESRRLDAIPLESPDASPLEGLSHILPLLRFPIRETGRLINSEGHDGLAR